VTTQHLDDPRTPRISDPSLILAHGTDAPDPDDPAQPPDQDHRLNALMAGRLTRRALFGGAVGAVGVGALAGPLGSVASAASSAPTGSADDLNAALDEDYLRHVTETVVGFGDTSSGFRPGGSPANLAAVDWIATEMERVGMKRVAKLPVPIDRWVFNGASVAVDGGDTYEASSWGGVPGTPTGGIHAEVVDLGNGFEPDFDAADVRGKIVLINWQYGDIWVNRFAAQATLDGAVAIIFYTGTTPAGAFYNKRDDGLLGFDGTYDDNWVPFVFVTRNAANELRALIAAGTTMVTLTSDVELTRAEDGGVGYNVLGSIQGTDRSDEYIIFTGHHDAWFHGAADDATAIAAMLGIAKAIKASGFRPRRTLLFLASTNEEYGYTDAYYEWLIGCWYAVTHQKPEWGKRAVLTLDFELLGTGDPSERLLIRTHSELYDQAVTVLNSDGSLTPYGTLSQNTVWANADHFTLTAAGIPGIYFNTVGTEYLTRNYHTNFDILSAVDFSYLSQNIQVINRVWVPHDRSTLPMLDFELRAAEAESRINFVVDGTTIQELPGVDQSLQDGLEAAVGAFGLAAKELDDRLAQGSVMSKNRVGALMMSAERKILRQLVALDVFDQYIFPHQQLQRDATRMQLAVNALKAGNPVTALDLVRRTGLTNAGRHFAHSTYAAELERHEPDFDRLQWGGQAHLSPYVDVWNEFHSIDEKITDGKTDASDYASEIGSLEGKLGPQYQRLNQRLEAMTQVFAAATRKLDRARRKAG
jgi:Iap family predicted aminopeptidase